MKKRKNIFDCVELQKETKLTILEKFVLLFVKEQTEFNREESHVLKFKKWRGKTYVLSHKLTHPVHFNCRCNVSPQTPIDVTKSYIPDWKADRNYFILKNETKQEVLDNFKKEWEKAMDGMRGKNANFIVVDDLKEVKEKQVTDIETATIYTTYWDSNPDSQGNGVARHSIKKEHLEAMKKRGEILDYQIDDIGIKITKRWELKEDKTEGILKSKRIEL